MQDQLKKNLSEKWKMLNCLYHFPTPQSNPPDADAFVPFPRYQVYIRNPDRKAVNWNDWLAPFSPRLWIAFVLQSIVSAMLMVIVCYLVRRLGSGEEELTLYDQMFLVYGALICQQGQEGTPRSWSCRILFFVVYVTGTKLTKL